MKPATQPCRDANPVLPHAKFVTDATAARRQGDAAASPKQGRLGGARSAGICC